MWMGAAGDPERHLAGPLEGLLAMREDNTPLEELSLATLALGGAAVGAGFGGLIGAVVGWIMGAQVTTTPQIGPVVGQWVLPSTLVGLLAGVGIGALIGALAAISSVRQKPRVPRARAGATVPLDNEASIPAGEELFAPALAEEPADIVAASSTAVTEVAPDDTEPMPATPAAEAPQEPASTLKSIPRRRRRIKPGIFVGDMPAAAGIPPGET